MTVSLADWECVPRAELLQKSSSIETGASNKSVIATYLLINLTDLMLCSVLERHGVGRILEDLCKIVGWTDGWIGKRLVLEEVFGVLGGWRVHNDVEERKAEEEH